MLGRLRGDLLSFLISHPPPRAPLERVFWLFLCLIFYVGLTGLVPTPSTYVPCFCSHAPLINRDAPRAIPTQIVALPQFLTVVVSRPIAWLGSRPSWPPALPCWLGRCLLLYCFDFCLSGCLVVTISARFTLSPGHLSRCPPARL